MTGVVAVGDSITNSCSPDLVYDGVPPRSWVQWVASAAGEPLTVHARPGASAGQVRALFADDMERYSLAFVYAGVNNIISWRWWRREGLAAELTAIIEKAMGQADRVAVMQYPDALGRCRVPLAYGPGLRQRVLVAQEQLRCVVATTGATLISRPDLTVPGRVWIDGVHPTSSGHRAMAEAAVTQLGLPPLPGYEPASPRPDFTRWRARFYANFALRQPVRGVGAWAMR